MDKLKDFSPYSATKTKAPLGKPEYRKWNRVYYKDEFLKATKKSVETTVPKQAPAKAKSAVLVKDTLYVTRIIVKDSVKTNNKTYKAGDTATLYSNYKYDAWFPFLSGSLADDSNVYTFGVETVINESTIPSRKSLIVAFKNLSDYHNYTIRQKSLNTVLNFFHNMDLNIIDIKAIIGPDQRMVINTPDLLSDTAHLILYRHRKLIPISVHRKKGKKNLYFETIEAKHAAQIESADFFIKDGFIDNMSIIVKDDTTKLQFTNSYPIPLSSKKNLRMLNQTFLYANAPGGLSYKLCLGEVMQYYFAVEKDQYDLSPSDTLLKFEFKNNKVVEIATLKKEDKNKIFEYRVFTDFIGLDETKPNGLVQIEAQRKFKLYTKYSFQRFPIGGLRYIEPSFKWNKIENQKSFLQPFSTDTFSVDSVRQSGVTKAQYNARRNGFVTPLDLYLYQQISVGFNLNLISGYNGNTKLKYNIDGILNFGRTKIRDSIPEVDTSYTPYRVVNSKQAPKELKVNTLQWGLSFKVQFFPEARYGFTIGAKYLNIYLANMDFKQKNKSYLNAYTDDTYFNRGIVCSEIQVHKNFDNDSKFYIRYVFNSQLNNFKYNFSQFQVGYNAFLKF